MKTGKTLSELAVQLQANALNKLDYIADTREIMLDPGNSSMIVGSKDPLSATDHCHQQLSTWTGIGSRYYQKMKVESPALLAGNVNYWLHQEREKPVTRLVRSLNGKARAFLSDRYLRLDNEHIAETTLRALELVDDLTLISSDITESKLYMKFVFPKTEAEVKVGDSVQSGVMITNSEIGGGAFQISPFWYRLICTNGCASITKGDGYKRTHLGPKIDNAGINYQQDTIAAAANATLLECRDAVKQFADPDYFKAQVEQLKEASQTSRIKNPIKAMEVISKEIGLSEFESNSILERLIRDRDYTKYGMTNAVTNLANGIESYDRASELEQLGGRVLSLNNAQWERVAIAA